MTELKDVLEIDLSQVEKEATETRKTLKDLRNEVKELRAALENTELGTDEFAQALDELTKKQQELTNVTKSGVKAQEGSYNDLVNQMAILKKEWRSTADEARRAALGDKINDLNSKLKEFDSTIGNHQRNVGNYNDKVEGLSQTVVTTTDNFEELNRADINWIETTEHTVKVATGMAGAFTAVQGAINLMGIESEATAEMILKMQSVMAITEGLKAIAEGVDSFGKLKDTVTTATTSVGGMTGVVSKFSVALKAIPILAVVGGIVALISNKDKIEKFFKGLTNESLKASKQMREFNSQIGEKAAASAADNIVQLRMLARTYNEFGDNIEAKTKFIEDNSDALSDMGIQINDVNDAEDVFNKNTDTYVNALMQRARAEAARTLATEKYEEYLKKRLELEDKLLEAEALRAAGTPDKTFSQNMSGSFLYARRGPLTKEQIAAYERTDESIAEGNVENARKAIEEADNEIKEIINKLGGIANDYTQQSSKVLNIAVEDTTNNITEAITSTAENIKTTFESVPNIIREIKPESLLKASDFDVITPEMFGIDVIEKTTDDIEERLNRSYKKFVGAMSYFQLNMSKALTTYDTAYEKFDREGDNYALAETDLNFLEREKLNLTILRDELLNTLAQTPKESELFGQISMELLATEQRMKVLGELLQTAANNLNVAKADTLNNIFGSVQESFDFIMSMEVGFKFKEEMQIAYDAVQQGMDLISKSLAKGEKGWMKYGQVAALGLNTTANILNSLSEDQDASTKEGFEQQKNLQIAAASMSMLAGVVNAVQSSFSSTNAWMGIWGQAAAAAATSAMVITSGILQINEIKKQKLDGAGVSASTGGPQIPSMSAVAAAQPTVLPTTSIQGSSVEGTTSNQRVYVLEQDITNTQNNVRTTVSEATF